MWLLFSGKKEGFSYGDQHYRWRDARERPLLNQLYELYQQEGVGMSYTMKDFERDFTSEHLHLLTPQERLKGLASEERLEGLSPEEQLKGLPTESVMKQFPLEERLKGLSPEMIEAYLLRLKQPKN